jgi:Holliday junction resolvasome RuvABC endonuclease subunit
VHFHTSGEVKAAVTGNGGADKAQVTAMVTRILRLQAKPNDETLRTAGSRNQDRSRWDQFSPR